MLQGGVIFLIILLYMGMLFALAYYGDKRAAQGRSIIRNPIVYALSMAVYCTAWTFYGSVGRAATSGVGFLPIYLGPTLMAGLWWFVLRKFIRISKMYRITSIADLAASRYGKSQLLGGFVALIAIAGIVPYISLQLDAVATTFNLIWTFPNMNPQTPMGQIFTVEDTAFYVAIVLAVFAILFGARHLDLTEHHEGLVAAIAFESVIKLIAFLAVGIFVTFVMFGGVNDLFSQAGAIPSVQRLFVLTPGKGPGGDVYGDWAWLTFLSMMAILFLPRQFQVAVVENTQERHLNRAIWLFPLYLLAINVFVLPIAIGGLLRFPGGAVNADTFVLTLPLAAGQEPLTVLAFIGGFSAAISMVIMATVALSAMASNDLVLPLLIHLRMVRLNQGGDLSGLLLTIRRIAIVVIVLLSYFYFRLTGENNSLVAIGLISFAAVAQFAPAVLGGLYWKGGTRLGAFAGLAAGILTWGYTLLLPSMASNMWLPETLVSQGPFGIAWLKPHALFGFNGYEPVSHGMFWSMLFNIGAYVGVSFLSKQSILERNQARLFVDVFTQPYGSEGQSLWRGNASAPALMNLLRRILGEERADEAMKTFALRQGAAWPLGAEATPAFIQHAEMLLAGSIGAASAHVAVASVVQETTLSMDELIRMFDETSQAIAYSRELEERSRQLERQSRRLEIAYQELQAANEQLKELDALKDEFVSTVTHELRTPLTSIRAFSEILHDNPTLDTERRQQFLSIIMRESERLTRLINQVLDLAKMESGEMEWRRTPVDLADLIRDSAQSMGRLFAERQIELTLDLPPHAPLILVDRDRIQQVVLNLLSNATKFCDPDHGQVSVRLRVQPKWLIVAVSDNGPGVPEEAQTIIFEKFRQLGNASRGRPQGTGLGLPISREIVSHYGGQLTVQNNADAGATFTFTLSLDGAA